MSVVYHVCDDASRWSEQDQVQMTESAFPEDPQLAARDVVHAFVRRSLARYTAATVERDVALDVGLGRADLLLSFPMGWRVVHQLLDRPRMIGELAERTDAFTRAGVDVLWWVCGAAETLDLHAWQHERGGASYVVGWSGRVALPGTIHRADGAWIRCLVAPAPDRGWEGTGLERLFLTQWREMALVRYFELWEQVSTLRLLRALAGTATLRASFGGTISGLKQQGLVRRVRGSTGLWRPVDLVHIFPHVPRWPAEGIAAAHAYARAARHP